MWILSFLFKKTINIKNFNMFIILIDKSTWTELVYNGVLHTCIIVQKPKGNNKKLQVLKHLFLLLSFCLIWKVTFLLPQNLLLKLYSTYTNIVGCMMIFEVFALFFANDSLDMLIFHFRIEIKIYTFLIFIFSNKYTEKTGLHFTRMLCLE